LKKVLIVTPNWPPVSCPDLHRVRIALPYFIEFGWEPLILKIDPNEQEGIKDPQLALTIPKDIRTWQAGCIPRSVTEWIGLRNVGWRSIVHLARLGDRIIERERPAAIFFSTTMFPVMAIGRYWQKRYGVPYILDFQDPWLSDYQRAGRPSVASAKYAVSQQMAKWLEPFSLRKAAHVITVSSAYVDMLGTRYQWLQEGMMTVLPFGAAESDFDVLRGLGIQQQQFNTRDGKRHWVYVGRGGDDMAFALRAFFGGLSKAVAEDAALRQNLRIHFIGTDYAPGSRSRKTVEPLAVAAGVQEMVIERPDRIPYFEALGCLRDAEALIVPGSDDPGYVASKIYPYVLARKPLLAIFHEASGVVAFLKKIAAGVVVTFKTNDDVSRVANTIASTWFSQKIAAPPLDPTAFEPYTAREMTRKLCSLFDSV